MFEYFFLAGGILTRYAHYKNYEFGIEKNCRISLWKGDSGIRIRASVSVSDIIFSKYPRRNIFKFLRIDFLSLNSNSNSKSVQISNSYKLYVKLIFPNKPVNTRYQVKIIFDFMILQTKGKNHTIRVTTCSFTR